MLKPKAYAALAILSQFWFINSELKVALEFLVKRTAIDTASIPLTNGINA